MALYFCVPCLACVHVWHVCMCACLACVHVCVCVADLPITCRRVPVGTLFHSWNSLPPPPRSLSLSFCLAAPLFVVWSFRHWSCAWSVHVVACYCFHSYVCISPPCLQKSGAAIVSDPERDKTMIQELLELKNKVDRIIRESFQNQSKFYDVVRVGTGCHACCYRCNGNHSQCDTFVSHMHTPGIHVFACGCVCVFVECFFHGGYCSCRIRLSQWSIVGRISQQS